MSINLLPIFVVIVLLSLAGIALAAVFLRRRSHSTKTNVTHITQTASEPPPMAGTPSHRGGLREYLRIGGAFVAAMVIVILSAGWADGLIDRQEAFKAQSVSQLQHKARLHNLASEQKRWSKVSVSTQAGKDMREKAQRTLQTLAELYDQERQLWTYYDALSQSHDTHESYLATSQELERQLAEKERALQELRDRIDSFEPRGEIDGITFTP